MAVALYATMLVQPGNVEAVRRYLYATTEVVEASPVGEWRGDDVVWGEKVFLVLRTEERTEALAQAAQQNQCDRLASGLHTMTVGFATKADARNHAWERATDNDWGLRDFAPFVLAAV